MTNNRDSGFENFVRDASLTNKLGAFGGMAVLFFLGFFLVYYGFKLPFVPILLIGLLPWGGIAWLIFRYKGELKSDEYWINLLVQQPEKIIWIKPIRVRHTAAVVITLYQEMHFQLRTSDGLAFTIKCDSPEDQKLFFSGLMQYVPHAHYGYDAQAEQVYSAFRPQFIEMLKQQERYLPVAQLKLPTD